MKKLTMPFLFSFVVFLSTMVAAATRTNTSDFTINVHVSSSGSMMIPSIPVPVVLQVLKVVIMGKHYELSSDGPGGGLIAIGDYKAKLVKDEHYPTGETLKAYELALPNGTVRKFDVTEESE